MAAGAPLHRLMSSIMPVSRSQAISPESWKGGMFASRRCCRMGAEGVYCNSVVKC